MPLAVFLNALVESIGVLLGTWVGVFLGTEEVRARLVVGSRPEISETVDLTSKGRERFGSAVPPAVATETGEVRLECWFLLVVHGSLM